MFCSKCGKEINDEAVVCVHCGCAVSDKKPAANQEGKSKIAAGLFGIFLGCFGVHNFYLGRIGRGIIQLVLFFVGAVTSIIGIGAVILLGLGVWALIEGILCFTGSYKDARGRDLVG